MPIYRFTWDNFDDRTITSLADAWGYDSSQMDVNRRDWLAETVKRPTDDFVKRTKRIIESVWLSSHTTTAASIVERLLVEGIGPRERPETEQGYVDYIRKCRNTKSIRSLLREALIRHGDADRVLVGDDVDPFGGFVPRFARIKPDEQKPDGLEPYPYQEDAWQALNEHLSRSETTGRLEGLLVMPTGSGKTYTAVRWLVSNHVKRGGRVLWIAHRYDLLEQAAHAFHRAAFLASGVPILQIRIVSGVHCPASAIWHEDNVIVCSIQSLSRRPEVVADLLRDENLFLVIDEAHHSTATSYRRLIEMLQPRQKRFVLGLTATPTRTVEDERPLLAKLFGQTKIYEVRFRDLVERDYLARPYPEIVKTNVAVGEGVTEADVQHLERFQDLSEEWQKRIANIENRNALIIARYLEHKQRYGKTLIFAINVAHAQLLRDSMRLEGVEAEFVASYRPDGLPMDNREVVERFRDPKSGLEVLINVEILTEGVDIPIIQTVFLARPTRSEILLRQMIGRAMRGPKVGGTARAYIVSFEDHWGEFTDWESPLALVPDIVECAPEPATGIEPAISTPEKLTEEIPWDLVKALAEELRRNLRPTEIEAFEAVPHGWYVVERDDDGETVRQVIHVYEHQKPCWEAAIGDLWGGATTVKPSSAYIGGGDDRPFTDSTTANDQNRLHDEFFYDCDLPKPSKHHVGELLQHFLAGGVEPEYHDFAARSLADPHAIAEEIVSKSLGERDKSQLISSRHELPLTKAVYPSLREFYEAVNSALFDNLHPDQATRIPLASVVFDPLPNRTMAPEPAPELRTLMDEAMLEASRLLDVQNLSYDGPVEWTRRVMCGWFAKAFWDTELPAGTGRIAVNCLLNSRDIEPDTLKFLLWHEFLHLYLQAGHTPRFRELERLWPGKAAADSQLDRLHEEFRIPAWY